jgi:hypothetical protein
MIVTCFFLVEPIVVVMWYICPCSLFPPHYKSTPLCWWRKQRTNGGKCNHRNGLTRKKQQATTIQTSNERTNTQSRQVGNALVRRNDFKNFKEEKF